MQESGPPKENCAEFRRGDSGTIINMSEYKWSDDGCEVCITIPVPEPIPKEQVRCGKRKI